MNKGVWYLCFLYSIIRRWFHNHDFFVKIIEFILGINDFFVPERLNCPKIRCKRLFTECGSENASVFCYLQSVGVKAQMCFAIYRV